MKEAAPLTRSGSRSTSASDPVGRRRADCGDGRGVLLEKIRRIIREADPEAVEERKWKKLSNPAGVPGCSHDGTLRVCDVPASVRSGRGPHRATASRLISPWTIRSSVST